MILLAIELRKVNGFLYKILRFHLPIKKTATKYIVTKLLLKWPLTHITVALTGINTVRDECAICDT